MAYRAWRDALFEAVSARYHACVGTCRRPPARRRRWCTLDCDDLPVCVFCLDRLPRDAQWTATCGHVFHRACFGTWETHGHPTCPLCGAVVAPAPRRYAPPPGPVPLHVRLPACALYLCAYALVGVLLHREGLPSGFPQETT